MDLVKLEKEKVMTDSLLVAKKFGKEHRHVVHKITKLKESMSKIKGETYVRLKFEKSSRTYKGQVYDIYLMNREAFSLLVMQFTGEKALKWQLKFNDAFYDMETALLKEQLNKNNVEWGRARQQSIGARRKETDVIKLFVDYATKQGSQNAKFYYANITKMTYKCLGLIQYNKPKLRDALDQMELSHLLVAENMAAKRILQYMGEQEHYKVIFEKVKEDIINYNKIVMI